MAVYVGTNDIEREKKTTPRTSKIHMAKRTKKKIGK